MGHWRGRGELLRATLASHSADPQMEHIVLFKWKDGVDADALMKKGQAAWPASVSPPSLQPGG